MFNYVLLVLNTKNVQIKNVVNHAKLHFQFKIWHFIKVNMIIEKVVLVVYLNVSPNPSLWKKDVYNVMKIFSFALNVLINFIFNQIVHVIYVNGNLCGILMIEFVMNAMKHYAIIILAVTDVIQRSWQQEILLLIFKKFKNTFIN